MRSWLRRYGRAVIPAVALLFGLSKATALRAAQAQDRIREEIDDHVTVTMRGSVRPEVSRATALEDAGDDFPMRHMILQLKADAGQETALAKLIEQQQDPLSPIYHKFLTPQQYGEQFGASPNDIARLTAWLRGHGFTVEQVPEGRRSIVFSGTAGAVARAFGTPIRKITVNGEVHYANTEDPKIPAVLSSIVAGVVKLNDFQHKPSIQRVRPLARDTNSVPQFTSGGSHYLSPADYATIYNLAPLYANQIDGSGQSIAIVGRSNISISDVQTFRSESGLPANNPTVIIASGTDPGFVAGDGDEATLDVEWSGAVAPNATVKLVVASSTATADGVDLAAQYIVNKNLAPVMSVSFGSCEAAMGLGGVAFYNSLWQQAAAQGITVLISSGDSGAAGCNYGGSPTGSMRGVNGLCSSPYDVCVGGTEFVEGSNPGQYWLPGNNQVMGSAQGYIPEKVWNESSSSGGSGLWAGGGGASIYFQKPSWQTGVGVPADGARDVPDVALTAAEHDGYLIEEYGSLYVIAGTSASSPSFAGMMALLNQKMGTRLGAPNANLYRLASLQTAGGAKVFHDTTAGSNSVPGVTGFSATTGYDPASGLGSVDAAVMVNHWSDAVGTPAAPSLAAAITPGTISLVPGASTSFTVTVTPAGGFKSAVTLSVSGVPAGASLTLSPASIASPGSGSISATLIGSKTVAAGSYTITVIATGAGLTAKASTTLTVTNPSFVLTSSAPAASVTPGATTTVSMSLTPSGGFNSAVTLAASGLPSGVTASFSPASLAGSGASTLIVTAAQNAKAGTYPLTITATGGGITKALSISLTVNAAPNFTLTTSAASVTIVPGTAAQTTVITTPNATFVSPISLSIALPAGVQATFSAATIGAPGNGTRAITFNAASSVKAGTYTATITAVGGGLTRAAALQIAVQAAPSFTLGLSNQFITVKPGTSLPVKMSITGTSGGFNTPITLLVAGSQAGIAVNFAPSTLTVANPASTLTISVANNAQPGIYTIALAGTTNKAYQVLLLSVTIPSSGQTKH